MKRCKECGTELPRSNRTGFCVLCTEKHRTPAERLAAWDAVIDEQRRVQGAAYPLIAGAARAVEEVDPDELEEYASRPRRNRALENLAADVEECEYQLSLGRRLSHDLLGTLGVNVTVARNNIKWGTPAQKDAFHDLDLRTRAILKQAVPEGSPQENPPGKVTYLAVMPRNRKPKTVPPSAAGFYQGKARYFYEAPGMTADQARKAIAAGELKPTWINGQPVVAYSAETGKPRTEKRTSLADMTALIEKHGPNALLRIGGDVYTPQMVYYPYRETYHPHVQQGPKYAWHLVGPSGFTYDPAPVSHKELMQQVEGHATFELALLREDDRGFPTAAFYVAARAGLTFADLDTPAFRQRAASLSGRRYGIVKLVDGGQLRQADIT